MSGAANQVTYVYRKLGGDVLDIELSTANIYTAYEEAVLEYSYIVNVHQANNSLSGILDIEPALLDLGHLKSTGDTALSSSLNGTHAALKLPSLILDMAEESQRVSAQKLVLAEGTRNILLLSMWFTENKTTVCKILYLLHKHISYRFGYDIKQFRAFGG